MLASSCRARLIGSICKASRRPYSLTAILRTSDPSQFTYSPLESSKRHAVEHDKAVHEVLALHHRGAVLNGVVFADVLRRAYPDHALTTTDHTHDLREFARTGLFTTKLDATLFNDSSRERDNKVDREVVLTDDVAFGRLDCTWKGKSFYAYAIEWVRADYIAKRIFFLTPRDYDRDVDRGNGRSAFVEDLLKAALEHRAELDQEIWVYDDGSWERSEMLYKSVMKNDWQTVILTEELKQAVMSEIVKFFDRKQYYSSFGVPWKRGLIFHGLPGNGKTISIKAIIRSLASRSAPIPTLYVKSLGSRISPERDVREIFEKARETSPCLLVFEDLDSLVRDNVRSFFLNEVDGLEGNDGILMIGSTNYLDRLDPGISKRPSRFDRKYHFPLPAHAERRKYCDHWRKKFANNGAVDFTQDLCDKIADSTEGLSFAYLQELFVSSMNEIIDHDAQSLSSGSKEPSSVNTSSSTHSGPPTKRTSSTELWNVISKQVASIRREMTESKKSVEDSGKYSATEDAMSGGSRKTGFATS